MTYNNLLEKLILPFGDYLLKTSLIRRLHECRYYDCLTEEELSNLQLLKLQKILAHVINNSLYYRSLPITPNQRDPISTLKQFPILSKEVIRENTVSILTVPKTNLIKLVSSGSSGTQGTVFLSKDEISVTRAQQIRWWEWAGYKLGDRLLQTGMAEKRSLIKGLKDFFLRTKYVHAFAPSDDEIYNILQTASKKSTKHFYGYASSLNVFAEVAIKNNMDLSFDSIVSWGDKLFKHYQKNLTTAFHSKVNETYGTTEGFMIAAQYDLPYLYIMTPWLYLELLDDDGNEVDDGEIGHVVVTSLFAKSFPLIRYKLGDLAIKLPVEKYPNDRKLPYPLLEKVIGRDTDIVKTSSGKKMIVHSFTGIFEYYPEIRQFQVIQKQLDQITIKYIPSSGDINLTLTEIAKKIKNMLKEDISIHFEETDFISPSPSGKPQIIISHLQ